MASTATTVKRPTVTQIADVTGAKKKGNPGGKRTKPILNLNEPRAGAIANIARTIASRNNGYVNAEMVLRELADHPVFQESIPGPEGSNVEPAVAYTLLTTAKIKDWYKKIWAGLEAKGVDPSKSHEEGGPRKGALPVLASMRGQTQIQWDEL